MSNGVHAVQMVTGTSRALVYTFMIIGYGLATIPADGTDFTVAAKLMHYHLFVRNTSIKKRKP